MKILIYKGVFTFPYKKSIYQPFVVTEPFVLKADVSNRLLLSVPVYFIRKNERKKGCSFLFCITGAWQKIQGTKNKCQFMLNV